MSTLAEVLSVVCCRWHKAVVACGFNRFPMSGRYLEANRRSTQFANKGLTSPAEKRLEKMATYLVDGIAAGYRCVHVFESMPDIDSAMLPY